MSDKTCLSNAELEFTQKFQLHFPRGVIPVEELQKWNGCPAEFISAQCIKTFGKFPEPIPEPLLELLGTVTIPATTERFVAKEKFVRDVSRKARVKISYLGGNFTEWLLGKIEESRGQIELRQGKLKRASADGPIISELGGHSNVATPLSGIWHLLASGKLDKKMWYVFYVEDEVRFSEDEAVAFTNSGGQRVVLRAVYVYWRGDGWFLFAYSVLYPRRWNDGDQFFSRNSVS